MDPKKLYQQTAQPPSNLGTPKQPAILQAKLRPGLWPKDDWWLEFHHPDAFHKMKQVHCFTGTLRKNPAYLLQQLKSLANMVRMDWGLELHPEPDVLSWNEWLAERMPHKWPK